MHVAELTPAVNSAHGKELWIGTLADSTQKHMRAVFR